MSPLPPYRTVINGATVDGWKFHCRCVIGKSNGKSVQPKLVHQPGRRDCPSEHESALILGGSYTPSPNITLCQQRPLVWPYLTRFSPSSPSRRVVLPIVESGGNDACYLNKGGHMCCDHALESAMMSAIAKGTLLAAAGSIQKMAESKFGGKFEAVVGHDDFAYRNHYKDGKTCKVEMGGKYALAWQP
uniref:Ground-like domain-containing protein n=1 Tax=Plectus sambesii TaxID=2011161 RepID=A0A914V9P0_9BILA